MNRPASEIQAEIAALEACLTYAPPRTAFGEDNHRNIRAQIAYLKAGDLDETADEFNDLPVIVQDALLEAQAWAEGMSDEKPSAGWEIYKK